MSRVSRTLLALTVLLVPLGAYAIHRAFIFDFGALLAELDGRADSAIELPACRPRECDELRERAELSAYSSVDLTDEQLSSVTQQLRDDGAVDPVSAFAPLRCRLIEEHPNEFFSAALQQVEGVDERFTVAVNRRRLHALQQDELARCRALFPSPTSSTLDRLWEQHGVSLLRSAYELERRLIPERAEQRHERLIERALQDRDAGTNALIRGLAPVPEYVRCTHSVERRLLPRDAGQGSQNVFRIATVAVYAGPRLHWADYVDAESGERLPAESVAPLYFAPLLQEWAERVRAGDSTGTLNEPVGCGLSVFSERHSGPMAFPDGMRRTLFLRCVEGEWEHPVVPPLAED